MKRERFINIFSKSYVKLVWPEVPEVDRVMKIIVEPNHSPFYYLPRRLSFYGKNELSKIIDDLLTRNIIRVSESEYSSLVVLVSKKDSSIRLCRL